MSWSTMNGVNRSRLAVPQGGGGMRGTQPPVVGMMGTNPNTNLSAPMAAPGMMKPGANAAAGMRGPNDGVMTQLPHQQQQSQFQPMPQPQFDPNDPRNAALAGYMNRG